MGDLRVFNGLCFFQLLAFYPLGEKRARRNGRTATIGLELGVFNDALIVNRRPILCGNAEPNAVLRPKKCAHDGVKSL